MGELIEIWVGHETYWETVAQVVAEYRMAVYENTGKDR